MNALHLLLTLAAAIILCGVLYYAVASAYQRPRRVRFANIAEGRHATGNVTKLTDASISTRYLLGKDGSDDNHIAACGASDIPLGVITDEASAAEEPVNVAILGNAVGTLLVVASEAITVGEHVYTAASGKVQDLPGSAGTYYEVGVALTAASADGDVIEIAHTVARKTVVS